MPSGDRRPGYEGELAETQWRRHSCFPDLQPEHLRHEAQQYRLMAADAPVGWIQNEFSRIAGGLDRVAERKQKEAAERARSSNPAAPEQLLGLARAYRSLGSCATTDWTRRSFERIADELERRVGDHA
jgi:hypothetical protein